MFKRVPGTVKTVWDTIDLLNLPNPINNIGVDIIKSRFNVILIFNRFIISYLMKKTKLNKIEILDTTNIKDLELNLPVKNLLHGLSLVSLFLVQAQL